MALRPLLEKAKAASRGLARSTLVTRNDALDAIFAELIDRRAQVLKANDADLHEATQLSPAMQDRLALNDARFSGMVGALRAIAKQPNPLSGRREIGTGPSGIVVARQRVPLGVVAIVYEARPNVTLECAALCLKSGNAVVLRGGKEAGNTNKAIVEAIHAGLKRTQIDPASVTFIEDTGREGVLELLSATGFVDLLIPRGGKELMALVDAHARVPVIRHGQGICHVYIDENADATMAIDIAVNAKTQRPSVCNAMETLLIHERRMQDILPMLGSRLAEAGVELRADEACQKVLREARIFAKAATPSDYDTEFLSLILAIRAVQSLDEALDHIARHGTRHTASIVTNDEVAAHRFLDAVDASCVLWNASTRMNDGDELGLGAEMGIATTKLHAYGPMGALELTAEKLVVIGQGQVRR